MPKITYFGGLAREAQKRETGIIESEGDLRGGSVISGSETVIFWNSQVFSLNSPVLTFYLMSPFCVNSVEFMFMVREELMCVAIPGIGSTSRCSRTGILTSW